ncbi:MAG: VOC family protein [Bryobacteraceae bacterium]|nr:VOC family protein [Bryobacteraceae bacterium]
MLLAVALIALPLHMSAGELMVDHVTAAGRDLAAMRASLATVGIPSEYGGPHRNRATEMALTSFPDGSYLELIALQAKPDAAAVAAHGWAKWMEGDAGPCAWAVRSNDVAAEIARLGAAGVPVGAPVRSGRERPDGVRLDWETAQAGAEPNGTFFPFLIRDLTPRERRVYPASRPTTEDFTGVTRVVIAVRDLDAAVTRYREAYGLPAPARQEDADFGARLAAFEGAPVVLAAPLNGQSWLAARLHRHGEGPCAFVLKARKSSAYQVVRNSRWFAAGISWLDDAKLGWRLGFE